MNNNSDKKYNLSFTAGGVLYPETMIVIEAYLKNESWDTVHRLVSEENLLRTRTNSSSKRLYSEIKLRLSNTTKETLEEIYNSPSEDLRKQALWIVICKTYSFVSDFMIEVIQDKIDALNYAVSYDDYDRFYNKKSQWHDELDNITQSTKYKIRQVLFKMLKEMSFVSEEGAIIPIFYFDNLISKLIKMEFNNNFGIFPCSKRF